MFKTVPVLLALATTAFTAEISSSYTMPENHPVFKTEPVENRNMKEVGSEAEHPVYTADVRNQVRARIEPVRSFGPVIKHDTMLSDQPVVSTEANRNDKVGILANGYIPGTNDVAYPDVPYAPGYFYDPAPINYDLNSYNNYLMEPDTSTFGLLWSQVPEAARTMVGLVGSTFAWVFNSIFVLIIGSLITVGVCTYTNLCTITINGVGPIHEEVRGMMTPDRLEKISHVADFVKKAVDKYQDIQKVTEASSVRRRRAIFNY